MKMKYKILLAMLFLLIMQICFMPDIFAALESTVNVNGKEISMSEEYEIALDVEDTIKVTTYGNTNVIGYACKYKFQINNNIGQDSVEISGTTENTSEMYYEGIWEVQLTMKKAVDIEIQINVESDEWLGDVKEKHTYKIKVKNKKQLVFYEEMYKNENDKMAEDYKKDVNEVDKEHASKKLDYLKSILYNDKQNGNNELWEKFVSQTTPEQRKKWYRDIIYNIRNRDEDYQTAIRALETQISVDDGEDKQDALQGILNEARNCSTKCCKRK